MFLLLFMKKNGFRLLNELQIWPREVSGYNSNIQGGMMVKKGEIEEVLDGRDLDVLGVAESNIKVGNEAPHIEGWEWCGWGTGLVECTILISF